MKRRTGKVLQWELVALALIAVGLFAVLVSSTRVAKAQDYDARLRAATLSQDAFRAIRAARSQAGLAIDEINDPNRTGLVGSQYSLITSGRGDLSGALTATNPNFAAVVLAVLRKAGLHRNDVVAVGLSGSLPALNIEVLAACEVLGLRPMVISTASSGMWGANDPRFTWLDMEAVLSRTGVLPVHSVAASLGGEGDNGLGLSPAGRAWLDSALTRNQVPLLVGADLADAVAQRMAAYRRAAQGERIRAFIAVGNSAANQGIFGRPLPTGLVNRRPADLPGPSVVRAMAEQGARVINLTDVARLAYRYKFPVAPVPLPALAKGRMFAERKYSVNLAIAFTVLIVILLFGVIELDVDYYVRRWFGRRTRLENRP
jgi:poly-gamma-glutamate system protein